MNPGKLRQKIMIKYNSAPDQTDANGVPLEDWQELMTIYAGKSGLKGRLFYEAASVHAESDAIFTIRYREGIKAGMRIIHGSDIYEINAPPVDADGRRRWLEIHARQVLTNGG